VKVLHCPVNIGNHPWVLSRYEREAGIQSDLVVTDSSWLKYSSDRQLTHPGEARWSGALKRAIFGIAAPIQYDVIHYYFGRSIIPGDAGQKFAYADVRWARQLGRPLFFTLQGCDVRLAHRSNQRNEVTMCRRGACREFDNCVNGVDARRQRFISNILPLADQVYYMNPELGHYVAGANFLPYANVDIDAVRPQPEERGAKRRPLILHAPSDPGIKGTPEIVAAVETLRHHYDFDFRLVEGLEHAQAVKLYRDADLVLDQLYAGWYGGFAVEVMAMAKPVACYLRDDDLGFLPAEMRSDLPLLRITPGSLEQQLASFFDQRDRWPEWGAAARAFVEKWHHPRRIARALVAAYRAPSQPFDAQTIAVSTG
jgi:glycosyltransferase involved in cell wall biosynthesis